MQTEKVTLKQIVDTLQSVSVKEYAKEKNRLKYLSWSRCEHILNTYFPNNQIDVNYFDGKPYLYDNVLGYMVSITVTIEGHSKTMMLPVMDGANKALKAERQSYFVANWVTEQGKKVKNGEIEKFIDAANMFDINNALMRCRVKCIALFGLGLDLYEGEDMPKVKTPEDAKPFLEAGTERFDTVVTHIKNSIGKLDQIQIMAQIRKRYRLDDHIVILLAKYFTDGKD